MEYFGAIRTNEMCFYVHYVFHVVKIKFSKAKICKCFFLNLPYIDFFSNVKKSKIILLRQSISSNTFKSKYSHNLKRDKIK